LLFSLKREREKYGAKQEDEKEEEEAKSSIFLSPPPLLCYLFKSALGGDCMYSVDDDERIKFRFVLSNYSAQ
jgi:hypothetical protein